MPSVFFKIGQTDLTAYVDVQTYAVNKEDVYDEWTDANRIDHREIVRQRRSGAFSLGFSTAAAFSAWTALLSSAKTADGYYAVTAYINNTGSSDTFNAFLDVSHPEDKWDLKHNRHWLVAQVTLTER